METMVIAGAGECGTRAAFALRQRGFTGRVVLVDEEGYLPYERPSLSKPAGGQVACREIFPEEYFAEQGITLLHQRKITRLDTGGKRVELDGGDMLAYDRLLLATGASPRRLGGVNGPVCYFRTRDDAEQVYQQAGPGRRVVLIGAGLIGMELAATLRQLGCEVLVLESGPAAMGRAVPGRFAEVLTRLHQSHGVGFRFNAQLEAIDQGVVRLADGEVIAADLVVVAIGVTPNTRLAEEAGLTVDNGIVVDARQQTSAPCVYAAGDCARGPSPYLHGLARFESWKNACDQGENAAAAMLDQPASPLPPPFFWSDQYQLSLQVVGMFDPSAAAACLNVTEQSALLFQAYPAGILTAVAGLGPESEMAREVKLAGRIIEARLPIVMDDVLSGKTSLKAVLKQGTSAVAGGAE